MIIVLDRERPVSWNRYYAGIHWASRARMAKDVHWKVREVLGCGCEPFDEPVSITVRAYMKGKLLDADNVCAKMYIDGLKGLVIKDDDYKCVKSVTTEVHKDNKNPRVEIEVNPLVKAG